MQSVSRRLENSASALPVSTRWPAIAALVLGLMLVAGAGFAAPSFIHNATHDTRHAFGLPCH
jgi:cobalt transporter subunit CbtB